MADSRSVPKVVLCDTLKSTPRQRALRPRGMHMLLRWRQECIPIKKSLRHMDRVSRGQVKGGGGKRVSGGVDVVGRQTCYISLQAFYFVQDLW